MRRPVQVGPGFAALPGPRPDPNVPADTDRALLTLDPATPAQPRDWVLALAPGAVALGGGWPMAATRRMRRIGWWRT